MTVLSIESSIPQTTALSYKNKICHFFVTGGATGRWNLLNASVMFFTCLARNNL